MSDSTTANLRNTIGFIRWWRQFCQDNHVTHKDGFASDVQFDAEFAVAKFRFMSLHKSFGINHYWDMGLAFGTSEDCVSDLERELVEQIRKLKEAVQ